MRPKQHVTLLPLRMSICGPRQKGDGHELSIGYIWLSMSSDISASIVNPVDWMDMAKVRRA